MADRAEIAKRVAQAEKLLQRGKTGEALDEYLQILLEDPDNDNVRSMAADLCLSLSRTAEAVTLLGDLFERQVALGDATRASLTYKKLARHGNPTWQQKFRFGQLLDHLGFLVEDREDRSLRDVEDEQLLAVVEHHQAELERRHQPVA